MSKDGTAGLIDNSSIVLLAKKRGRTSFQSLSSVKHALNTKKVGHTGTLDKFAEGLLVVCVGNLTRLAQKITSFNKTYEAVIAFGKETDTLDPEGTVIIEKSLPLYKDFLESLNHAKGKILQTPPAFSAIHIEGKRASDIMRSGKTIEMPSREVEVFDSELLEISFDDNDLELNQDMRHVKYALVRFSVSKGTYIRSLARDIAKSCSSAGHLVGLLRVSVGSFNVRDAAGFDELEPFTIQNVLNQCKDSELFSKENKDFTHIQNEIISKKKIMESKIALECGFSVATINRDSEDDFYNGRHLLPSMFENSIENLKNPVAVFTESGKFIGVIEKDSFSNLKYSFVIR